jgi:hypothetical protein
VVNPVPSELHVLPFQRAIKGVGELKFPVAYKPGPLPSLNTASAYTAPGAPARLAQVEPVHTETKTSPPAYNLGPLPESNVAKARIGAPNPDPSRDQLVPFQRAMLFADRPPA